MDIELHVDGLFGRGSLRMSVMYDWPIGEQFGIVRKEGRLQKLRLEPKLQLRVEPADMEPFSIVSNGNGKVEAIEAKLKNALGSRDRDMMKEALADALDLAEEKVLSMTSKDRPLYDALVGMAEYSNLGYSTPIMTNYMESMTRNVMDKCRGVLRH
jgi:phosphoglycolate phosphatase-like HAD superfamily hydrolase